VDNSPFPGPVSERVKDYWQSKEKTDKHQRTRLTRKPGRLPPAQDLLISYVNQGVRRIFRRFFLVPIDTLSAAGRQCVASPLPDRVFRNRTKSGIKQLEEYLIEDIHEDTSL